MLFSAVVGCCDTAGGTCFVGVEGCSFLLSDDLFRRKKFNPLFLLLVLTGVSGAVGSPVPSLSLSLSLGWWDEDLSLFDDEDDDLEDRNIGKKLWLEEFFDSFCGVGGVATDGLIVTVCCCVGEVGDVCCLVATGTGLLESILADDDVVVDGEVAAVFSVTGDDGAPPAPPVGSVRPLDFVETPPLAAGESFRLSVSLIKSSTLEMLLLGACSLLLLLALSGTSVGCCFSEFGSILLFVIALC